MPYGIQQIHYQKLAMELRDLVDWLGDVRCVVAKAAARELGGDSYTARPGRFTGVEEANLLVMLEKLSDANCIW